MKLPRPILFLFVYLLWGSAIWLYGWVKGPGSGCVNAFAFVEELLSRLLAIPPKGGFQAYFCWLGGATEHRFWLALMFFMLLPGVLTLGSLWLRDRWMGVRHIDLKA